MTKKLIGLYSTYPQSGKSTVAFAIVQQKGFIVLPFAGPLKDLVAKFIEKLGFTSEQASDLVYNKKDEQIEGLPFKVSPRYLMQKLGTDFGRNMIDQGIWLHVWISSFSNLPPEVNGVVVDDVRFENEADRIKELGGEVWKVERSLPNSKKSVLSDLWRRLKKLALPSLAENHASEQNLESYKFDRVIVNNGTVEDLFAKVAQALGRGEGVRE